MTHFHLICDGRIDGRRKENIMFGNKRSKNEEINLFTLEGMKYINEVKCNFCKRPIKVDRTQIYDVEIDFQTYTGEPIGTKTWSVIECKKCGCQTQLYQKWAQRKSREVII
jgi:hypothetical protein